VPYGIRTTAQVEWYFAGLDLVSPGVVPVNGACARPRRTHRPRQAGLSVAGIARGEHDLAARSQEILRRELGHPDE